ncbi:hypothetical protein GH153_00975 [bacterium]|nr:hypothetical protein [bacterium]
MGFVFIPKIADVSILELTGLKRLCADDDYLVVFSPASMIEDVSLKGMLRDKKIVQSSLVSSVNLQTFELPIETLISGILKPKTERKVTPLKKPEAKKRRKRKIKLTDKQKEICERIQRGATVSELASEKSCSVANIRQQYKKAEEKLKELNASSRSINFQQIQRIPTDKRGQEIVEDKG